MLNEFCLVGLALVGLGRCNAQCGVLGLCPDEQPRVGHQGQCGELCPGRRLLYEVRPQREGEGLRLLRVLQQEGEGLRPLRVLRHDGLPQLVGAKLQFMRDEHASNTGADA